MTDYVLVEKTQDSALYLEGAGAQQTTTVFMPHLLLP